MLYNITSSSDSKWKSHFKHTTILYTRHAAYYITMTCESTIGVAMVKCDWNVPNLYFFADASVG